jgi:glucose-6-phosphate isomerase
MAIMEGAKQAESDLQKIDNDNIAIVYAALRNTLLQTGKTIEILANYEPRTSMIAAWWKQLFGESEGKEGKGIFPASVDFTCDLHSMGQYIQEGPRNLFETVLQVSNSTSKLTIPRDKENHDNLNYLAGKEIDYVNKMAAKGTLEAHTEGGVPNIIIDIPKLNPYTIGYLIYFFELACGISAYMIDVNPFDQPGVEAYKSKMFKLLGKPN